MALCLKSICLCAPMCTSAGRLAKPIALNKSYKYENENDSKRRGLRQTNDCIVII